LAEDYLTAYKLRHPQSAKFAEYAIAHVKRLLGSKMFVDCNEATLTSYQNERLNEGAAPKTINEEVGFLLRILGRARRYSSRPPPEAKAIKAESWQAHWQSLYR
jgi:hypothetical protein